MKRLILLVLLLFLGMLLVQAKPSIIDKISVQEKIVGLTLEDVEDTATLTGILTICQSQDVEATLFCPAQFVKKTPYAFVKLQGLGWDLGVCGLRYQAWSELRREEILRECLLAKEILPKSKIMFVRPPYEFYEQSVITALEEQNDALILRGITITLDLFVFPEIEQGNILNINMNNEDSLKILQHTIQELKKQGFKIKPVSYLMKDKPM